MSHPALQRIESGLAASAQTLRAGDFDRMQEQLVLVLDALAEVTRAGFVPRQQRHEAPWDEARSTHLVWDLLVRFRAADCHVFAYAGTLLGLERDGRLLPGDKDADFAVWLEDYALAGRLLQQWGLQRATDTPPFANMATFVDAGSGCSVDLFGLRRDPLRERTEGGVWLYGKPPSHQRLVLLPWFELETRSSPAGNVWWPSAPDLVLTAMYGDWRTRRAEWDSLVSNPSIQETNLNWRCWALKGLCQCWLTGDLARTRRLVDQILARTPHDAQLRGWGEALDRAVAAA